MWKLNTLHLEDENFVSKIKNIINRAKGEGNTLPPDEKWDFVKSEIIQFCKKFSKRTALKKNLNKINLEKCLNILQNDIVDAIDRDTLQQAIDNIEKEIESIDQEKINASIFRSKVKITRDWEKNSSYFFSLEKRKYCSKNIKALKNAKGEIIKEQDKILKEQNNFYKTLYTDNKETIFNIRPKKDETLLDPCLKSIFEAELTLEELSTNLGKMNSGKCPGLDGLPKEFYTKFFAEVGPLLLENYNYCYTKGKLNRSARYGLISLIPKKETDLMLLPSYRPLTLLSVDFKILSKTMAERLKIALPGIISVEQSGFMENRNISENIRRTFEVIKYTKKNNIPALIMTIDFRKCFDLIEHNAIFGALKYFQFPDSYIKWTRLFYNDLQIFTQNYGFLAEPFVKLRGTNQGCNFSPFAFLLCSEIMARKLKQNEEIQGVTVNGTKCLLSQFADDTTLYLKFEKLTLENVISTFEYIEANTGLTINYDKTLLYRTGSLTGSDAMIYTNRTLHWTNEPFKLLGITMSENEHEKCNYEKSLTSMENILHSWYNRQLSLTGKVLVINTLCESLFVYKMSVLPDITADILQRIDKIINNYLWKGKSARISKDTLRLSKSKGGLRLFNPPLKQMSLKMSWLPKIKKQGFFRNCFLDNVRLPDTDFIFNINMRESDCKFFCNTSEFWGQMWTHWCKISYKEPQCLEELLNQHLWFNSNIRIGGKPAFIDELYTAGIRKIFDIYDPREDDGISKVAAPNASWLKYGSLKNALPPMWKYWLRTKKISLDFELSNEEIPLPLTGIPKFIYSSNIDVNSDCIMSKYRTRWYYDVGT